MKMRRENRNFNESDATFLGKAEIITAQLAKHLADFAAFDAGLFTEHYVQLLSQKQTAIEQILSDTVYRSVLSEKTLEMHSCMEQALEEMHLAKYFIEKFAGKKKEIVQSFGYADLHRKRTKPDVVLSVFDGFVAAMQREAEKLRAVHYPQAHMVQLPILLTQFQEKRAQQRQYKKDRVLFTQERVQRLNALYAEMQQIQHVARDYVYPHKPKMQALFSLK